MRCVQAVLVFTLVATPLTSTSPASALNPADGRFTVTDVIANSEPASGGGAGSYFTGTDPLGLPWTPSGVFPTQCAKNHSAGVALTVDTGVKLPCHADTSDTPSGNGRADLVIVEGYLFLPDGATELSLQMRNDHPSTGARHAGTFNLYTAPTDDRSTMTHKSTLNAPLNSTVTSTASVGTFEASPPCAVSPVVSFRVYLYDPDGDLTFSMRWRVTGGTGSTGGSYVPIPLSNLTTVNAYDTDPANSGTREYQQVDTDGDTIPDWVEMNNQASGSTIDTDGDGTPNCADPDSDNDGSSDGVDANRLVPTATADSIAAAQQEVISVNVLSNDAEFAGSNNVATDLGTGSATGHTLSATGLLGWDTTGVAVGTHTIDYRVCNEDATPTVCADATATVTLTQESDLVVTVNYTPAVVTPGEDVILTATVINNGPSNTTGASATITAPTGSTFDTADLPAACIAVTATTVTCDHSGIAGDSTDYVLTLRSDSAATPGSTSTGGSVVASGDIADPDTSNSTTPINITFGPAVTDFAPPEASLPLPIATPNTAYTLAISTTNNGPSVAPVGPTTRLVLPAGVTLDVSAPNPSNCIADPFTPAPTLTCDMPGPHGAGTSPGIQVPLRIAAGVTCLNPIVITLEQLATDPSDPEFLSITLPLAPNDSDADGMTDQTEYGGDCSSPLDTDGDGTPDYLDTDSDDDGILDIDEGGANFDSDGDGMPDRLDHLGATISGHVFLDENLDGIRQADEQDISRVVVNLMSAGPDGDLGTADDLIEATDTTQSPFTFHNIDHGSYQVQVDETTLPDAVYPSHSFTSDVVVTGHQATATSSLDFGHAYASIGGHVSDAAGSAVPNAVVTVTDSEGSIHTTTSDENGDYVVRGTQASPLPRGRTTVQTLVNGVAATAEIDIATAATYEAPLSISPSTAVLPITGSSRSQSLLQAGALAFIAGAFLIGVSHQARRRA